LASLATDMDAEHKTLHDRLARFKGAEFDRDYMAAMVKDHQEAVELFGAAAQGLKDADLRDFAARTLPTIREHLDMARKLADTDKVKEKKR
jgi:putative membrane protein